MERRELLKMIAAATGLAMVGDAFAWEELPAATSLETSGFSKADALLLDELFETILPRTETPGAKDAGVMPFAIGFVRDCYLPQQQALFEAGIVDIDKRAQAEHAMSFVKLTAEQRLTMVEALDEEATAFNNGESTAWTGEGHDGAPHYFTLMKQLAIFGFFTSKVGGEQVLRWVPVPGKYEDIKYTPGETSFSNVWP